MYISPSAFRDLQEFAGVCRSLHRYEYFSKEFPHLLSGICRSLQGFVRVCIGMNIFPRNFRRLQEFAFVFRGLLLFVYICIGFQGFPGVSRDLQVFCVGLYISPSAFMDLQEFAGVRRSRFSGN